MYVDPKISDMGKLGGDPCGINVTYLQEVARYARPCGCYTVCAENREVSDGWLIE